MADIPTPAHCTADFCLIPVCLLPVSSPPLTVQIGTSSPSMAAQVADVQRLVQQSGLKYSMHSAGTTLEGSWDRVHQVIGQAHYILHQQGIVRIQSDIRVGSRLVLDYTVQAYTDCTGRTNTNHSMTRCPRWTSYCVVDNKSMFYLA